MAVVTFSGGARNRETTYRNASVTLHVQFKDPDGAAVDVLGPVGYLLFEGVSQTLDAIGSAPDEALRYSLIDVPGVTGLYKLVFLTTGLRPGMYRVGFEGTWADADGEQHVLRVEGNIALGEVTRKDELIRRIQYALMDDIDPRYYRLDEPIHQWTADQLYVHLLAAMDSINAFPPRLTAFTIDDLPFDQFAVDGGRVYALYARARFEKANELTYSDVHTLDIKRADFYKSLADTLHERWRALVIDFKKATPPTPIGLTSQRLPFRIRRVLGLLPNFRSLFSG